jgi:FKBP-type peptidyl-prolyl cis-trans isomerase (trigger factor)
MSYTRKTSTPTEITYEVTVPVNEFEKMADVEIKEVAKSIQVSGFRPGKVPVEMINDDQRTEAKKRALEKVISNQAAEVLRSDNVSPVMPPAVSITSFESGKPVVFSMTVYLIPQVTFPQISLLTTQKLPVTVDEKDVEGVEKNLWEQHRGKFKDKSDEWVASVAAKLGFSSKTIAELRDEIKHAVEREKNRIVEQKFAHDALMEAIEKAHVQIPEKLIQYEAEERERSFLSTLHQMNTTMEEFAKSRNVTIEELRTQWKKDAKEAVETDVILSDYARSRKVTVSDEEMEAEVALMKTQSKKPSDPMFDNPEWRGYIERVLLKRKSVQAFLDELVSSGAKGKR